VAAADPSALLGWHACLYRGQDLQAEHYHLCMTPFLHEMKRKEKKRKEKKRKEKKRLRLSATI